MFDRRESDTEKGLKTNFGLRGNENWRMNDAGAA